MADYGYIGRNPADSNTIIGRQIFTATSGQTSFTVTGGYDVGFIQVYLNGIKLIEGQDYYANDSRTVVIDDPAEVDDKLEVVAFKAFNVSVPSSTGTLSVTGDLNVAGSLGVVGFLTAAATALENITITGLSTFGSNNGIGTVTMGKESAAIFCDGNQRVVGVLTVGPPDTGVTIDGGNSRVGVGTTIPGAALEIVNTQARDSFRVADQLNPDYSPFVIDQSGNTGIGTLTPQTNFHVRSLNNKILARFRNEDGDENRCEIEFQDEQTSGNFKVKVGSQGDNFQAFCGFQSSIIFGDNLNSERVHIRAKVDTSGISYPDDGLGITGFGTFSDYNAAEDGVDTRIRVAGGIVFRPVLDDYSTETNMPGIWWGIDGTGGGGNNLEIATGSTDGAINFYTGARSSGRLGTASNKQRVVIGPNGQIGIGVTLGDTIGITTSESVVLGLGISMCQLNSNADGEAPILINAGPGDKSGSASRNISLGCTVTNSSTGGQNVRIGYSLAPVETGYTSVLIGHKISCNTNGGGENVYIGSEINENATDSAANGNVVIGHDLELVDSQDRSVLIGGLTDLATNPATNTDGAGGIATNITHTAGDLSLAYNNKHHFFSQYDGKSIVYHDGIPTIETTTSAAGLGVGATVNGDLGCSGSFYAGGSFSADALSANTVTAVEDDLNLRSADTNEAILLNQTSGTIDFTVDGSTTAQFLTNGVLRSGINGFTIQDTAGNTDFNLNTNGAITNLRTYTQTAAGSRAVRVTAAGIFGGLTSTEKSKTNIKNITTKDNSWIYKLKPVSFNYRVLDEETDQYTDEFYENVNYGFIAEEVEKVNPEICSYNINEDGTKEIYTVNYEELISPMLKAIQDLTTTVNTLKKEVASLKSQLNT